MPTAPARFNSINSDHPWACCFHSVCCQTALLGVGKRSSLKFESWVNLQSDLWPLQVWINGRLMKVSRLRRIVGYVPQVIEDPKQITVRDAVFIFESHTGFAPL